MGKPGYSAAELASAVDKAFTDNPPEVEGGTPDPETPTAPGPEGGAPAPPEAEPAGPEAGEKPRTLVIKHKGREYQLTEDEAVELAQQGYDYHQKMAALKQERGSYQRDQQKYEDYVRYVKYLEENPNVAEAIGRVLENYEARGAVPKIDFEGDPEPGTEKLPPAMLRSMRALEQKVDRMLGMRETDDLARRMISAVESHPILKAISERSLGAGRQDLALQKLADAMKADPSLTPETAAKAVATEFSLFSETLGVPTKAYVGTKKKDQASFGPAERPGDSPPAAAPPERREFSGADMKSGRLRQAVTQFLTNAQFQK